MKVKKIKSILKAPQTVDIVTDEMLNQAYSGNGITFLSKGDALIWLLDNGFMKFVKKDDKYPKIHKMREEKVYKKDGTISKTKTDYLVSFGGEPISGLRCKLSKVTDK